MFLSPVTKNYSKSAANKICEKKQKEHLIVSVNLAVKFTSYNHFWPFLSEQCLLWLKTQQLVVNGGEITVMLRFFAGVFFWKPHYLFWGGSDYRSECSACTLYALLEGNALKRLLGYFSSLWEKVFNNLNSIHLQNVCVKCWTKVM